MSRGRGRGPHSVIIVSGHLLVTDREAFLENCREVVSLGRAAAGCLDFALSPDLLDPRRVNVLERWASAGELAAFRGAGTSGDQAAMIVEASVSEYDVGDVRRL